MHILATQSAALDEAETAVDLAQSPADVVVMSFSDTDLAALAAAWEADGSLPSLRLADLKRLKHPMSVDLYVDRVVRHARAVVLRCLGGLEYWRYGLERIASVADRGGILLAALPGDDRPDPRLVGLSTLPPDALDRLDRYFRSGGPPNLRQGLRYLASLMGREISWEEPQALGPILGFRTGGDVYSVASAAGADGVITDPPSRTRPAVGRDQALPVEGTSSDTAGRHGSGTDVTAYHPGSADIQRTPFDVGQPATTTESHAENGRLQAIAELPGYPLPDEDEQSARPGGRPVALVLFYRALLMAGDTAPVTALMHALEREGVAPVAVALSSLKDPAIAGDLQRLIATHRPRIILNATAFSALRDDGSTILDGADVPVLQVVLAGTPRAAWSQSARGLSAADQAMHVVLPELDGRLLTRAVSFKEESLADPALEYAAVRNRPDPGRITYVASLAAAWARLGEKPRGKRRLAMMLSDYPARPGRAGYAVGLDTAQSVAGIVAMLAGNGFDVGDGVSAADVEAMLVAASASHIAGDDDAARTFGPADSGQLAIPVSIYNAWLAAFPTGLRDEIISAWGSPGEDPAVCGNAFHFRLIRAGKLIIALQPDRGSKADRKAGYHDATTPPRHAYVAFYAWLRQSENIDALIHLGTHGTLEWLPGKALALSESCWPEAVLGPMPVAYPFIVNNPGEAVQAKRRLGAVTIGHLTPAPRKAGLHGRLAELEQLVEEYAGADGIDRRRAVHLEQAIIGAAHASGFAGECDLGIGDAGRDAIARLDARLCDIKELSIRDRFHVFARAPGEADSRALATAMEAAVTDLTDTERAWAARALAASPAREGEALLRALDGRRVAPGPAGAPTRGRLDTLPTGRNLTSIDPRAIPTRTAATIGRLAAEEVIHRYLQDHGDYPRALVMTLWASASLRTGGDDIAQALHYLGAAPVWDPMSNRVTGIDIAPLAKLGRPRIDVTLRVSGLFRDLFETQIALLDLAVRRVAAREEDAADNPLAEARRRGDDLARIFGGAPGSYGAGVAPTVLDTAWTSREALGRIALAGVTHHYGADPESAAPHDGFSARIAASSALVQPQDNAERDLLEGDEVADFAGGMSAAAALLGANPALYHLDTSEPMTPRARTMAESVARVVHGRLTNPQWLAAMIAQGHRGVAEIAQGVDALYAMAATTGMVAPHLFEAVHEAVLAEDGAFAAMVARNPAAAAAIVRRLQDALARGMWTPRRNAVADELATALCRATGGAGRIMEAAR